MNFNNIRYKDIILIILTIFISYEVVSNYGVFLGLLKKFLVILTPFFYALIFAYILNPIMKLFEKRFKLKRGGAVAITYVLVAGILVLIGLYIIPSIIDSIISITKEIPNYVDTVQNWINEILKNEKVYSLMQEAGIVQTITTLSAKMGTIVMTLLEGTIGSLVTITTDVVMIVLGFLISIYVLLDKENFIKQSKTLVLMILGKKRGLWLIDLIRTYNKMIGTYIGIKAIDSLIIAIIALVGLILIKAPYAILVAVVVGFTNMIPYFGPLVGELVGAIIAVFVSPWKAIAVFLFLLAVQQFDAWYLDPKLIGGKVGVKPFLIILAVTIGGGFFGAIGMLLASPTIATIKIYYDRRINKFKDKNEELLKKV